MMPLFLLFVQSVQGIGDGQAVEGGRWCRWRCGHNVLNRHPDTVYDLVPKEKSIRREKDF